MAQTFVVALGGNAITRESEEGNIYEQFENTRRSLAGVVHLIGQGHRVIITHGNGPQVGNELIRVENARHLVPPMPLGVIVADLEGGMGYMIEQCLQNKLHDAGIHRDVTTVLTQVMVNPDDPSIKEPTKFVGPFFKKEEVEKLTRERGWIMKEDKGRGYRRVVPSPKPVEIVEKKVIKLLLDAGGVVVAAGGGGIPVYRDERGWLEGVDGVIDKDLASALLGNEVGAETLVILTGVDKVALGFGTPQQKDLDHMTVEEAQRALDAGEFPKGSMGPKIQAAINFLNGGGQKVIITSIENAVSALQGGTGTVITKTE
ncbi:MAG: carbamate kinase [Calditrichaeota bacterium]|nr:MAG: carbamate kinase [Calditrichota bacterium]